ncbi:793_t:CDS:2 [Funneliformis mosseae]|uniref:793_t:CDS:1 n=1 Tax=Funneliformis mosseae TaxID=27381 RepID=A0A9N9FWR9_FUNMO|nr:793_t:CDS:2 [Funneliformis mosseae]
MVSCDENLHHLTNKIHRSDVTKLSINDSHNWGIFDSEDENALGVLPSFGIWIPSERLCNSLSIFAA